MSPPYARARYWTCPRFDSLYSGMPRIAWAPAARIGRCASRVRVVLRRQYREWIDVYGSKRSFEWSLIEHEPPILHTAKRPEAKIPRKLTVHDHAARLPAPLRRFTRQGVYDVGTKTHLSFTHGSRQGGSHPHRAHEFISALIEDREPYPNVERSANWTCVGRCAHASALAKGKR